MLSRAALISNLRSAVLVGAFVAGTAIVHAQTISTIAGNGASSYSGDGGLAVSAGLNRPRGVAFDASGNMYIADELNHRIRRVTPGGIITTFAGTGTGGFSGDGGQAVNAQLNQPGSLAFNANGSLIIADSQNRRIRKVNSSNGIITTIAGTGTEGFSGDGGPATSAMLRRAVDLAVDAFGNVYFADSVDHRIRKISTNGLISTVAGNGIQGYSGNGGQATSASLRFPVGIALDAAGNLYIADAGNHVVREVTTTGIIFNAAGNGTGAGTDSGSFSGDGGGAVSAGLNTPEDVVADSAGTLFIADTANNRIRKVTSNGIITTIAGTGSDGFSGDGGSALGATFNFPWAVALDASGNLLIGDAFNHRVRRVSPAGAPPPVVGGEPGPALTYYFPHLVLGEVWQTTLTYINYSSQTVTCQTHFYSDSGAPMGVPFGGTAASSRIDTLAPGGSFHAQTTADPNGPSMAGWAQASCDGPIKASLLFRAYQQGVPRAEVGVNAMTTPATKFVTFAEQKTGIAYANPSTQPALVTVTAMDTTGATLGSKSLTLLAGAHGAANIGPLLDLNSFTGSVQITSTVPIVSLSLNFEADPIFSSLPPGDLL